MNNDVILNKISVIERCIKRINEEYDNNPKNLQSPETRTSFFSETLCPRKAVLNVIEKLDMVK